MPVQQIADITIEPVDHDEFAPFVEYLTDQLSDNGNGGMPYFHPIPRSESTLSPARAAAFQGALTLPFGALGWRRAWRARAADGQIAGHVDLRSHPDNHAGHRCVLGMGVHRDHRQRGLGRLLIAHAEQWAAQHAPLEWIDLQVMSVNQPAVRLYHRSGFTTIGEIPDMFKIDGHSFAFTLMAKRIAK